MVKKKEENRTTRVCEQQNIRRNHDPVGRLMRFERTKIRPGQDFLNPQSDRVQVWTDKEEDSLLQQGSGRYNGSQKGDLIEMSTGKRVKKVANLLLLKVRSAVKRWRLSTTTRWVFPGR